MKKRVGGVLLAVITVFILMPGVFAEFQAVNTGSFNGVTTRCMQDSQYARGNPSNSVDITFVFNGAPPSGAVTEMQRFYDYMLNTAPFSEFAQSDRINMRYVASDSSLDLSCCKSGLTPCNTAWVTDVASVCPTDEIIVISNRIDVDRIMCQRAQAFGSYGQYAIVFSGFTSLDIAHEFAKSMAFLGEERLYGGGNGKAALVDDFAQRAGIYKNMLSPLNFPNCDKEGCKGYSTDGSTCVYAKCDKWNRLSGDCLQGCGFSDYFRDNANDIMGGGSQVSKVEMRQIRNGLNRYVGGGYVEDPMSIEMNKKMDDLMIQQFLNKNKGVVRNLPDLPGLQYKETQEIKLENVDVHVRAEVGRNVVQNLWEVIRVMVGLIMSVFVSCNDTTDLDHKCFDSGDIKQTIEPNGPTKMKYWITDFSREYKSGDTVEMRLMGKVKLEGSVRYNFVADVDNTKTYCVEWFDFIEWDCKQKCSIPCPDLNENRIVPWSIEFDVELDAETKYSKGSNGIVKAEPVITKVIVPSDLRDKIIVSGASPGGGGLCKIGMKKGECSTPCTVNQYCVKIGNENKCVDKSGVCLDMQGNYLCKDSEVCVSGPDGAECKFVRDMSTCSGGCKDSEFCVDAGGYLDDILIDMIYNFDTDPANKFVSQQCRDDPSKVCFSKNVEKILDDVGYVFRFSTDTFSVGDYSNTKEPKNTFIDFYVKDKSDRPDLDLAGVEVMADGQGVKTRVSGMAHMNLPIEDVGLGEKDNCVNGMPVGFTGLSADEQKSFTRTVSSNDPDAYGYIKLPKDYTNQQVAETFNRGHLCSPKSDDAVQWNAVDIAWNIFPTDLTGRDVMDNYPDDPEWMNLRRLIGVGYRVIPNKPYYVDYQTVSDINGDGVVDSGDWIYSQGDSSIEMYFQFEGGNEDGSGAKLTMSIDPYPFIAPLTMESPDISKSWRKGFGYAQTYLKSSYGDVVLEPGFNIVWGKDPNSDHQYEVFARSIIGASGGVPRSNFMNWIKASYVAPYISRALYEVAAFPIRDVSKQFGIVNEYFEPGIDLDLGNWMYVLNLKNIEGEYGIYSYSLKQKCADPGDGSFNSDVEACGKERDLCISDCAVSQDIEACKEICSDVFDSCLDRAYDAIGCWSAYKAYPNRASVIYDNGLDKCIIDVSDRQGSEDCVNSLGLNMNQNYDVKQYYEVEYAYGINGDVAAGGVDGFVTYGNLKTWNPYKPARDSDGNVVRYYLYLTGDQATYDSLVAASKGNSDGSVNPQYIAGAYVELLSGLENPTHLFAFRGRTKLKDGAMGVEQGLKCMGAVLVDSDKRAWDGSNIFAPPELVAATIYPTTRSNYKDNYAICDKDGKEVIPIGGNYVPIGRQDRDTEI